MKPIEKIIYILLFSCFLFVGCLALQSQKGFEAYQKNTYWKTEDIFLKPYQIRILNDHDVQLSFEKDTIYLMLENAYSLCDEKVIFIKQK